MRLLAVLIPLLFFSCEQTTETNTNTQYDQEADTSIVEQQNGVDLPEYSIEESHDTIDFEVDLNDYYYDPTQKPDTLKQYYLSIEPDKVDSLYSWSRRDTGKNGSVTLKHVYSDPSAFSLKVKGKGNEEVFNASISKFDVEKWVPWKGFVAYSLITQFNLMHVDKQHDRVLITFVFGEPETDNVGEFVVVFSMSGEVLFIGESQFFGGGPEVKADTDSASEYLLTANGLLSLDSREYTFEFDVEKRYLVSALMLGDFIVATFLPEESENYVGVMEMYDFSGELIDSLPFSGFTEELGYVSFCFNTKTGDYVCYDPDEDRLLQLREEGELLVTFKQLNMIPLRDVEIELVADEYKAHSFYQFDTEDAEKITFFESKNTGEIEFYSVVIE